MAINQLRCPKCKAVISRAAVYCELCGHNIERTVKKAEQVAARAAALDAARKAVQRTEGPARAVKTAPKAPPKPAAKPGKKTAPTRPAAQTGEKKKGGCGCGCFTFLLLLIGAGFFIFQVANVQLPPELAGVVQEIRQAVEQVLEGSGGNQEPSQPDTSQVPADIEPDVPEPPEEQPALAGILRTKRGYYASTELETLLEAMEYRRTGDESALKALLASKKLGNVKSGLRVELLEAEPVNGWAKVRILDRETEFYVEAQALGPDTE